MNRDKTIKKLADSFSNILASARNYGLQQGETGYLDSGGNLVRDPRVSGEPNKIWVRMNGSKEAVAVWNYRVSNKQAGVSVYVAENADGELEIVNVRAVRFDANYGAAAPAYNRVEAPPTVDRESKVVSQLLDLKAGVSTNTPMNWSITSGWTQYGYFTGGEIHAGPLPAANNKAWYWVGLDPKDNSLIVGKSDDIPSATQTTVSDINFNEFKSGIIYIAATLLYDTSVSLNDNDIYDIRNAFSALTTGFDEFVEVNGVFNSKTSAEISNGAVTLSSSVVTISADGGSGSDVLDSISLNIDFSLYTGKAIHVTLVINSGSTITINSSSIKTPSGNDVTLYEDDVALFLVDENDTRMIAPNKHIAEQVNGINSGNTALQNLLAALENLGIIVDNTTAS